MKNIFRFYLSMMIILLFLVIIGCFKEAVKPGKYDGTYNISCISENVYTAIGDIKVIASRISGTMINTKNNQFNITGTVDEKGIILFNTIKNEHGRIAAVGQISDNDVVEGIYSVNTRKGKYFGFRYEKEEIDTKKNGTYEINFHRNAKKVANSRIKIQKGEFSSIIEVSNQIKYPIKGRMLKNGKIIINTVIGSQSKGIAASGKINNNSLNGIYFLHTGDKGTFHGKKVE